LNKKERKALQM